MPKKDSLLISLVSDQRMQNVLPVFQKELAFDRVLLIASALKDQINPRYQHIAQDLASALGGRVEVSLHPEPVDPYDPKAMQTLLAGILQYGGYEANVVINFTGGTKPMSVGAYLAGEASGVPRLYVDTFNERFLRYEPSGEITILPFQLAGITIPIYLLAHHRAIEVERTGQQQFQPEELIAAREIISQGRKGIRIADALHSRTFQKKSFNRYKLPQKLRIALEDARFWDDGALTDTGWEYFRSGRWLEAFTYLMLTDSKKFDDVTGPTFFESPPRVGGSESVTNEIDALALLRGKLGLIECKTRLRRRNVQRNVGGAQDILGKLKALRDVSGGLFGTGFIVTAQNESRISPVVFERAEEYRLTIIPRERLMDMADLVYHTLTRI